MSNVEYWERFFDRMGERETLAALVAKEISGLRPRQFNAKKQGSWGKGGRR